MDIKLSNEQIERWRVMIEDMRSDSEWIRRMNKILDQRREVRKEMVDFLNLFLSGKIDVKEFQVTFDRKTRRDWDVFGLKGLSGAMFLNKLVKYIKDTDTLNKQLIRALPAPEDSVEANQRMQSFIDFLNGVIEHTRVTKGQLQPARTPFFFSSWWHLQDTEKWPVFFPNIRSVLEYDEIYVPPDDWVEYYFTFRQVFLELASALELNVWEMEWLCGWYYNKDDDDEDGEEEPDEETEDKGGSEEGDYEDGKEVFNHSKIQWLLAKIGRKLGCHVWIAKNDHNKEHKGERLGDLSIKNLPSLSMDDESQKLISLIDVVWLKGANKVAAAFEVEHTTSIYSGLLRMSDLMLSSPNLNFPLYIVVPEERVKEVRRQLSRRTFQTLELHKICGYFSAEKLIREADAMMRWANDPSAMDRLALKVEDVINDEEFEV